MRDWLHGQLLQLLCSRPIDQINLPSAGAKVTEADSLLGRQVYHDESIDAGLLAVTKHALLTISQNRVVVSHQHDRSFQAPAPGITNDLQDRGNSNSIFQGLGVSLLDNGPIRDGVCERNAKFDNVCATVESSLVPYFPCVPQFSSRDPTKMTREMTYRHPHFLSPTKCQPPLHEWDIQQ